MSVQLAFDLSEPLPVWTGSPLGYHEEFLTLDQHAAALERWMAQDDRDGWGCRPRSHMWFASHQLDGEPNGHTFALLTADNRRAGTGPDAFMYQAMCERCSWNVVADRERVVVEAWHDHAMPGWRDLPVMPLGLPPANMDWLKPPKKAVAWIEEHVPAEWQFRCAPLRTMRPSAMATRHVLGRSPWFGFDLGYHPDREDQA